MSLSRRIAPPALAGALLLSACAGITPVTDANRQTPRMGGSAGQMGPGFCQTKPANVGDLQQWNNLCFPGN